MITLYFDYSKFTLEEIDTYQHATFECNGDKKEIKVSIPKKEKSEEEK